MKIIVEGTKQEIEGFENSNSLYCRFLECCDHCRFHTVD